MNGSFSKYKIISYLKVKEGRIRRSKSRDLPARIIPGRDYTRLNQQYNQLAVFQLFIVHAFQVYTLNL